MTTIRIEKSNTGAHLNALLTLLEDDNASKVVLFASEYDSSDTNSPLLATLVSYSIPNVGELNIIGDGTFLTAARYPRYLEVKELLDKAENHDKVYFSLRQVPPTGQLAIDEAVETLAAQQDLVQLTPDTRARFFRLLSSLSEQEYQELFR